MGDIPSVLIIEKTRFPAHVPVEECERIGKTADNKQAIIRYQRRADVGVVEQISRFFSDLFHGVTRAKGIVCDKADLPSTLHVRGERCSVTKEADNRKVQVAPLPEGQARHRAAFSALTIEVRDAEPYVLEQDPALACKVAEELRDRFDAHGIDTDQMALEVFLQLDSQTNIEMTPVRIVQLMHFSDAMGRMSGKLKKELGKDVLTHVVDRMQHRQDRITATTKAGPNGPAAAYPGFRFKGMSAYQTGSISTAHPQTAPAPHDPVPTQLPTQMTMPAAMPVMQPVPSQTVQQPLAGTQPRPQPQPQPLPQAQLQSAPPATALTTSLPPSTSPSPPPPPPPPPPPAIHAPAISHPATDSAAPDPGQLAMARERLKPAQINSLRAGAPLADDSAMARILAQAMARRRIDMEEKPSGRQDDETGVWE